MRPRLHLAQQHAMGVCWLRENCHRLDLVEKFPLTFARELLSRDFGTATSRDSIVIFLLTSFFINSMFQLVATKQRCEFSMNNGRENRTMATKKKAKKKKKH
jgi:hypothetical protein